MIKPIEKIPGEHTISLRKEIEKELLEAINQGLTMFEVTGYDNKYLATHVRSARDDITYKALKEAGQRRHLMSAYPYVKDWLKVTGRTIDGVKRVFCELNYPLLAENIKKATAEREADNARKLLERERIRAMRNERRGKVE